MSKQFCLIAIFTISTWQLLAQHTFVDVTASAGIVVSGSVSYGQSAGFCDIDNDGDLDIAFSYQQGANFHLFENNGAQFSEVTSSSGLSGIYASTILWAEITGDEFSDLITLSSIYRNNGNGTFTNITGVSGITGECRSVADFNNDGFADILTVGNVVRVYYNNGAGVFSDATVLNGSYICSSVCFDYDNDGDMDTYLGNNGGSQNILYRNNGDHTFTNVTQTAGLTCNLNTSGVTAGDYNNDGFFDLYLGIHQGQLSQPANILFKNNGDGTFSNVTAAAGATGSPSTRTASFADFNNDGWLDLFVDDHYAGNKLYKNNANGTFADVAASMNITGGFGDYFGTSWGDYYNDGAMDLFVAGHFHIFKLYKNNNCPNNYLKLKLHGISTNFNAIGVKIKLYAGSLNLTRYISMGDGMNDCHSLTVHVGTGSNIIVDSIEIFWRNSIQKLYSIPANQSIEVQEESSVGTGQSTFEPVSSIRLFPNPAEGDLTVMLSPVPSYPVKIEVFDTAGRIWNLGQDQFPSYHRYILNISCLPDGIYFMQVLFANQVFSKKFVKF